MKRFLIVLLVLFVAGFWLYESNKNDQRLDNEYNKCFNAYYDNALPLQHYMESCMK